MSLAATLYVTDEDGYHVTVEVSWDTDGTIWSEVADDVPLRNEVWSERGVYDPTPDALRYRAGDTYELSDRELAEAEELLRRQDEEISRLLAEIKNAHAGGNPKP